VEFHFRTSEASTKTAIMRTGRHWYVTATAVRSRVGDGQLAAGVPRKLASPIGK
jgi:hypothetical protein